MVSTYYSAPGTCGSRYRAHGSFNVYSTGCAAMGGVPTSSWGQCQMDFCIATNENDTVIYPTRVYTLFSNLLYYYIYSIYLQTNVPTRDIYA